MTGKSSVKPWQIVVIVAAVVAVAASLYSMFSDDSAVQVGREITLVDVTTGDRFIFPVDGGKAVVVPARNPETGRVALLPVEREEGGSCFVSRRDLAAIPYIEGEPKALVDRQSGEVRLSGSRAKRAP